MSNQFHSISAIPGVPFGEMALYRLYQNGRRSLGTPKEVTLAFVQHLGQQPGIRRGGDVDILTPPKGAFADVVISSGVTGPDVYERTVARANQSLPKVVGPEDRERLFGAYFREHAPFDARYQVQATRHFWSGRLSFSAPKPLED